MEFVDCLNLMVKLVQINMIVEMYVFKYALKNNF